MSTRLARSMPATTPRRMTAAAKSTAATWNASGCQTEPLKSVQYSSAAAPCRLPSRVTVKYFSVHPVTTE